MESAIYWVEYVARYQGAPNLIATSVNAAWYQHLNLDVLAFIFLVAYILAFVLYKILAMCCCCCWSKESSEDIIYTEERRNKRVKFE